MRDIAKQEKTTAARVALYKKIEPQLGSNGSKEIVRSEDFSLWFVDGKFYQLYFENRSYAGIAIPVTKNWIEYWIDQEIKRVANKLQKLENAKASL